MKIQTRAFLCQWLPIWIAGFNIGLSAGYALMHRWGWSAVSFAVFACACWQAKRGVAIARWLRGLQRTVARTEAD